MRINDFRIIVPLICLSFMAAESNASDDWPHWMGPDRDGIWKESGIIDSIPESGLKVDWRQPIGGGYAGPAIVDGRIYAMDRTKDKKKGIDVENNIRAAGEIPGGERVVCLDLADGKTIWEYQWESSYKIAYPNGPRCTPAVDDDRVYVLGAMGKLVCLKTEDGEVVWEKDLLSEYETKPPVWGYSSHPLVDGDQLIVPVGGDGSAVVSFDKMTGQEKWRSFTTIDIAYAPLVIFEDESGESQKTARQLVFWHGEGVTSLDPESGKEYWTVKFPNDPNPSITTIATPVIVGKQILISEFYKGSLLLEVESDPPAVKEIWRSYESDPRSRKSLNSMMTTPIVKDGFAYSIAFNARGAGMFRCIELESGEMKWTAENWLGEKPIQFASAFGVTNDDRQLLFCDTGELLIAKLSPEGFESVSRAKVLEPTTPARGRKVVWCHPAFANGKMVVRNDEEIVCVDLKQQ